MRLIDAEKLNREVKEHCKKLFDEGVREVDVVDIAIGSRRWSGGAQGERNVGNWLL